MLEHPSAGGVSCGGHHIGLQNIRFDSHELLRIIPIPNSIRSWIALIVGLAMLAGGGLYASFLTSSSKVSAAATGKEHVTFVGTAQEIEQHRQERIDKYIADYRVIHPDAPTERRKLLDSADTYVNDRIAQSGETWRFDKVTGKPAT